MTQSPKSAADADEVHLADTSLRWTRVAGTVEYELTFDAPSACYTTGEMHHTIKISDGLATLSIDADVAFRDGICAQSIKRLIFQGSASDIHGPFVVFATVTDRRSGRQTKLKAPN